MKNHRVLILVAITATLIALVSGNVLLASMWIMGVGCGWSTYDKL